MPLRRTLAVRPMVAAVFEWISVHSVGKPALRGAQGPSGQRQWPRTPKSVPKHRLPPGGQRHRLRKYALLPRRRGRAQTPRSPPRGTPLRPHPLPSFDRGNPWGGQLKAPGRSRKLRYTFKAACQRPQNRESCSSLPHRRFPPRGHGSPPIASPLCAGRSAAPLCRPQYRPPCGPVFAGPTAPSAPSPHHPRPHTSGECPMPPAPSPEHKADAPRAPPYPDARGSVSRPETLRVSGRATLRPGASPPRPFRKKDPTVKASRPETDLLRAAHFFFLLKCSTFDQAHSWSNKPLPRHGPGKRLAAHRKPPCAGRSAVPLRRPVFAWPMAPSAPATSTVMTITPRAARVLDQTGAQSQKPFRPHHRRAPRTPRPLRGLRPTPRDHRRQHAQRADLRRVHHPQY